MSRARLQLLGVTCMILAAYAHLLLHFVLVLTGCFPTISKFEEIQIPSLEEWAIISDNTCSRDEVYTLNCQITKKYVHVER